MHTFTGSDQVGDVVARFPKAAEVFKRHRIDFCCGGGRTIHDAAQASGLNEDRILQELNDLYAENANRNEQDVNWANESMGALVDHIVNVHHAYLNTTLPVLGELTTKILRAHGANHGELASVHRLFHSLKMEFEQHLIKEETFVFPKIVEFENQKSDASLDAALEAVQNLEEEHDRCGEILKEIRALTNDYTVPPDACGTYQYTFSKLEELESKTFTHIHLENNILFPKLRVAKERIRA